MIKSHGLKVIEKIGDISKLPKFGIMRLHLDCNRLIHFYYLRNAKGIGVCFRGKQFEIMKL